jgi:hypothetical protein
MNASAFNRRCNEIRKIKDRSAFWTKYFQVSGLATNLEVQYNHKLKTAKHQVTGVSKCFLPGIVAAGYDLTGKATQAANPDKCMDQCRAKNPSGW